MRLLTVDLLILVPKCCWFATVVGSTRLAGQARWCIGEAIRVAAGGVGPAV